MVTSDWTWNPAHAAAEPGAEVKNVDGEGHAIVSVYGRDPVYVGAARTSLVDLTPGKHTIQATLVNNDNTPLGTAATFEFEVK